MHGQRTISAPWVAMVASVALWFAGAGDPAFERNSSAADSAAVQIHGAGLQPGQLSDVELSAMPRVSVDVEDHGQHARFDGVPVAAILTRFGAPLGKELRADKLTLVLLVGAADGYRAAFALAELDPALRIG